MKNKNLLITGAATRVGKAIALHFAERGWNIALHYFRSSAKAKELKKIIEQHWVKVALIKADLKNTKQTERIIPLARKKLGAISCLVNNAALFEKDDMFAICLNILLENRTVGELRIETQPCVR